MKAIPLIRTPANFLSRIARGDPRTPSLYYHPNAVLREVFWWRLWAINRHMEALDLRGGRCADFGGGSGVFLPTLSARFDDVVCLDLETQDATQIVKHYRLPNITVRENDIAQEDFSLQPFDAIVAADVLEHFLDLNVPVSVLRNWLVPNGVLFTSLPTENWVYGLLRRLFGVTKPPDHYHNAGEVEAFLERSGFVALRRSYLPLLIPMVSLYHITTWRYAGE